MLICYDPDKVSDTKTSETLLSCSDSDCEAMDLEAQSRFCISLSGNCFCDPNKHQNTRTQQQQHDVASNGSAQLFNASSDERLEGKWGTILLAYQTMGVVFGGLVTSPLYVYPSMTLHVPSEENYLGIYSLMFWTLTLISVVKYIFIALHADDHGEGAKSILGRLGHFYSVSFLQMARRVSELFLFSLFMFCSRWASLTMAHCFPLLGREWYTACNKVLTKLDLLNAVLAISIMQLCNKPRQ